MDFTGPAFLPRKKSRPLSLKASRKRKRRRERELRRGAAKGASPSVDQTGTSRAGESDTAVASAAQPEQVAAGHDGTTDSEGSDDSMPPTQIEQDEEDQEGGLSSSLRRVQAPPPAMPSYSPPMSNCHICGMTLPSELVNAQVHIEQCSRFVELRQQKQSRAVVPSPPPPK